MAKGKNCPDCGHPMYAVKEEQAPKGAYVTYQCRNNKTKCGNIRVFEGK